MRLGVARVTMVAVLLLTAALSLFALQHRSAEGDLHVTTAIGALECAVDDAAPTGLLPGEHLSASAAELLLLLAVLLAAPLVWWTVQRLLAPSPPPRGPSLPALLPLPACCGYRTGAVRPRPRTHTHFDRGASP